MIARVLADVLMMATAGIAVAAEDKAAPPATQAKLSYRETATYSREWQE
jgi:hypothetical protein